MVRRALAEQNTSLTSSKLVVSLARSRVLIAAFNEGRASLRLFCRRDFVSIVEGRGRCGGVVVNSSGASVLFFHLSYGYSCYLRSHAVPELSIELWVIVSVIRGLLEETKSFVFALPLLSLFL